MSYRYRCGVLFVSGLSLIASAGFVHASPRIGQWVVRHSGQCLDVEGESKEAGAKLIQFTCKPNSPNGAQNQRFELKPVPYPGQTGEIVEMKSVHSGMCLDIEGASQADGAKVIQYTCKTSDRANQLFKLVPVFGSHQFQLQPMHAPGKCLDVGGASRAPAAGVIMYRCNRQANQTWMFKP